jgi:3-oxoacyl-[acyl-carrier-protein] synthase III
LSRREEGEIGFIDFVNEIDGSGGPALNLKGGGSLNPSSHETVDKKMHYIYQDGPAVYKFAVRKMAEATAKAAGAQRRDRRGPGLLYSLTRPTSGLLRRRRTGWGWTRSG